MGKPCHGKEGGVHERHGEGLGCQEVDLRGGSGLDEVGRSFARRLGNPKLDSIVVTFVHECTTYVV